MTPLASVHCRPGRRQAGRQAASEHERESGAVHVGTSRRMRAQGARGCALVSTRCGAVQVKAAELRFTTLRDTGTCHGLFMSDPTPIAAASRHRGIYLLPNLFTTGAMFAGFYAIVAAIGGRYTEAAMAVFVAARARWPGRPRGAPDRHPERIRRAVRLAVRPGQLRPGAGAGDVHLVAVGAARLRSGVGQGRLGRGVHLCRLRGAAAGPLQYPGRRGRQALFPGAGQSRPPPACACRSCGRWRSSASPAQRCAFVTPFARGRRRPADGQPLPLFQLQGVAAVATRAVHLDSRCGADRRRAGRRHRAGAVRDCGALRRVGPGA